MSPKKTKRTYVRNVTTFAVGLICVTSVAFSVPQKAHAQLLTFDVPNLVNMIVDWGIQYGMSLMTDGLLQKEVVWDTIANAAAKAALQSMAQSMINWAGSGFDGAPSFVTNYQQHMLRVQDGAVNRFINELASDGRIQSPFLSSVTQSARDSYYRTTGSGAFGSTYPYTLHTSCANDANFLGGDFGECGLSGWFAAWMNPANNPLGSEIITTDALLGQARSQGDQTREELRWGDGYLSVRGDCGAESTSAEGETAEGGEGEGEGEAVALSEEDENSNCPIRTLGGVTAHAVNRVAVDLGIDIGVSADEIDEILGTFFMNLISDTLTSGGGIAGGSPSYTRGAGSFTGSVNPGTGSTGGTGSAGSTTPSVTTINALNLSISNLTLSTQEFKDRWEAIQEVALAAQTRLLSCGATENFTGDLSTANPAQRLYTQEVKPALTNAEQALEKAEGALEGLEAFRVRAENARTGSEDWVTLVREFQEFQSEIPSPGEIIYAAQNSTELPDELEPNLFTKFKNYSESSCVEIRLGFGD